MSKAKKMRVLYQDHSSLQNQSPTDPCADDLPLLQQLKLANKNHSQLLLVVKDISSKISQLLQRSRKVTEQTQRTDQSQSKMAACKQGDESNSCEDQAPQITDEKEDEVRAQKEPVDSWKSKLRAGGVKQLAFVGTVLSSILYFIGPEIKLPL